MNCPNCFCEVADAVESCPCCGYVFEDRINRDSAVKREPSFFVNGNTHSNYVQVNEQKLNKNGKGKTGFNSDIKMNIIIVMLAIIMLLELLDFIFNF